jgi:hypothetical protein
MPQCDMSVAQPEREGSPPGYGALWQPPEAFDAALRHQGVPVEAPGQLAVPDRDRIAAATPATTRAEPARMRAVTASPRAAPPISSATIGVR